MISQLDLAYTAGIMDGEGCFCLAKSNRKAGGTFYTVFASVKMTDQTVPFWLQAVFGGNLYEEQAKNVQYARAYIWRISARQPLAAFIDSVLPYLKTKKLPALIVREFCVKFPVGNVQRTNETIAEMEKYKEFMQVANAKGPASAERKVQFLNLITGTGS